MPRSGTTLCEQILSSHSNVTGAGELNYLASLTEIVTSVQVEQEVQDKFKKNVYDNNFLQSVRQEYMKRDMQYKVIKTNDQNKCYVIKFVCISVSGFAFRARHSKLGRLKRVRRMRNF